MPDEVPAAITSRTIGQYVATLGSPDPTPGGGSASGIVGALGSALGQMALSLTDIDASDQAAILRDSKESLDSLHERFLGLARQDEKVYQAYRNATELPKRTDEEKALRKVAMQDALKKAAEVPLALCEASADLTEALAPVQAHGNRYLVSDAMVASTFARACFDASRILVDANLAAIKDADWVEEVGARLDDLASRVDATR
jgi:methenyltetrahydrofolate cyclohydrolase